MTVIIDILILLDGLSCTLYDCKQYILFYLNNGVNDNADNYIWWIMHFVSHRVVKDPLTLRTCCLLF